MAAKHKLVKMIRCVIDERHNLKKVAVYLNSDINLWPLRNGWIQLVNTKVPYCKEIDPIKDFIDLGLQSAPLTQETQKPAARWQRELWK